tara:strand:- start:176385 stop:177227 length:843 start_codon:yes stop_codon:yes gene_type:complete
MSKTKVAFHGKAGAYGAIASHTLYPNYELIESTSFQDVFDKVEQGVAKFGVVPVENSTVGRVTDVHNILRSTNLHIIREHFMQINHCLSAPKGATLESVENVYSHPQALAQCEQSLKNHGFCVNATSDTAGAAKFVADEGVLTKASLSSEYAAEKYNLEILVKNFQDSEQNTTRFLVVSKEALSHSYDQGMYITTLLFKIKNRPASLYKVLGAFATNDVNLVKIESYLCDGNLKSAEFSVDIEGHLDEKRMKNAMRELRFFTTSVKVIGCYPAHKFRKNM